MSHKHTIVVGLQHGDEGKGKFVDWFIDKNCIEHVVRFNGGPNAGHTMYVNNVKYVTHSIPSGIINSNVQCYIGPGCVINPSKLVEEIKTLESQGISNILSRLFIDKACHFITQEHIERDIAEDAISSVGSTKQGVSPCYSDKYARKGVTIMNYYNNAVDYLAQCFVDVGQKLRDLPTNTHILYEGAQGTMLDIDSLDYPNVTASHCTAPYAMVGSGYGMMQDPTVIGVIKPYLTKVGTGAFPSSIEGTSLAEMIREVGSEYGATTGRPRKIGLLNLNEAKKAIKLNGVNQLAVLKLDVLRETKQHALEVYSEEGTHRIPNWEKESFSDSKFVNFLVFLSTNLMAPRYIGTGPNREDMKEIT